MFIAMYTLVGIFGLLLGSFFNVVGLRIPLKESIVYPPSHCPQCQHRLGSLDLVPVFSYLSLRGRCRYCRAGISALYPLVELATGLLFVLAAYVWGWSAELVVIWALISLLMIILVADLTYMLIPDKILLFFTPIFIGLHIFLPQRSWLDALLGAGIGFLLLLVIAIVSRGGMGGGDIKLFALLGFVLGWQGVLLTFFFSTLYGTLFGGLGLLMGRVQRGKPMPFGPYIVLAALTTSFFQEQLLAWYFQFFQS